MVASSSRVISTPISSESLELDEGFRSYVEVARDRVGGRMTATSKRRSPTS
jgi:hypothetical protein